LEESEDASLRKVGKQLRPWAYGRYSEWLVGKANIKFSNPFVVLELDELSSEPELQAVVLNLILARITREMYLSAEKEMKELHTHLVELDYDSSIPDSPTILYQKASIVRISEPLILFKFHGKPFDLDGKEWPSGQAGGWRDRSRIVRGDIIPKSN